MTWERELEELAPPRGARPPDGRRRARRGFLFSRNRLNVAISRARCLAYLVCSPALLEARARTVDDMRLISTLCALVEEAARQRA